VAGTGEFEDSHWFALYAGGEFAVDVDGGVGIERSEADRGSADTGWIKGDSLLLVDGDGDGAVRGGHCAVCPVETEQVGDVYGVVAGAGRGDAQDVLREPCGGASGPGVTD